MTDMLRAPMPDPHLCNCKGAGSLYAGEHAFGCPMLNALLAVLAVPEPEDEVLALLREIATSPITVEIPGKYMEVQVSPRAWADFQNYVARLEASKR